MHFHFGVPIEVGFRPPINNSGVTRITAWLAYPSRAQAGLVSRYPVIILLGIIFCVSSRGRRTADPSTACRDRWAPLGGCDFLISLVVCGRKAPESICQQASPGFLRLRSGQALRLRAINPLISDRSARRFAQDDAFSEGIEKHPAGCKTSED